MVSSTPRPYFTPGKDPVPILEEAGWAPGTVWTVRKSRLQRDSIPDHPACSQSLYRLRYLAYHYVLADIKVPHKLSSGVRELEVSSHTFITLALPGLSGQLDAAAFQPSKERI